jgi:GDP-mannose transporter
MGYIEVDDIEQGKLVAFAPVAFAFLANIFANMKTLQYSNVETFIVFRASTPIVVCVCDYMFLGRELPSRKSALALLGMVVGACAYVATDKNFDGTGYVWVCIWYCIFCFDQVYIKHAIENVKMRSNWGRVFYTNFLGAIPLIFIGAGTSEGTTMTEHEWTSGSVIALTVSCSLGVGMSYFAFLCRKSVSATSFTLIGNCCKIATIIINLSMWDNHASGTGISMLLICLACAYGYTQAPLRADNVLPK